MVFLVLMNFHNHVNFSSIKNMLILPILVFLIFFGANSKCCSIDYCSMFYHDDYYDCFMFLLRFSIYISQRQSTLAAFHAIGYRFNTIKSYSPYKNNTLFLILVFVIPLLFMSELFYRAYQESLLSFNVIMIMMSVYFIVNSLLFIYTCVQESQSLKEVTHKMSNILIEASNISKNL